MKSDEYIAGGHHFWVHFWCGLVFGAGIGAWISWDVCDSTAMSVGVTSLIALAVALSCGRWGESAWEWILGQLHWFS